MMQLLVMLNFNNEGLKMRTVGTLIIIILISFTANAKIKLPTLVKDNMVLQRDIPIPVWGWADAGENIQLVFNNKIYHTTADSTGKWTIKLNSTPAGKAFEILIKSSTDEVRLTNILVGDVWLCAGQSNMEYTFNNSRANKLYASDIAGSVNDNIRQIKINKQFSDTIMNNVQASEWLSASPENLLSFSAVAYFYAKELNERYNIPIGLIYNNWGGTKAESWTSEEALKPFPQYAENIRFLHDKDALQTRIEKYKERIVNWEIKTSEEDKGYQSETPWYMPELNDHDWLNIAQSDLWNTHEFKNVSGSFWFRKELSIPIKNIKKDAHIYLCRVDDLDSTYFNGVKIGGYPNRDRVRDYKIPVALLREGKNQLTVRVMNWGGTGGMILEDPMKLIVDSNEIPIEGDWKYRQGFTSEGRPGLYNVQDLPTTLFNGMIAPIIPYAIKGVIWYQGESNANKATEYRDLFIAMINDWRNHWGQGDFPFIYQQLVNYKQPVNEPCHSEWAELREAQRQTLYSIPNVAMAVGIDIGEANDIHPVNKKDIGKRLALAARKIAYHEKKLLASGPTYKSMKIEGNKIILRFSNIGKGLVAKGGTLRHFAIAGENNKFVWAEAVIKRNTIIVSSKEVESPKTVRYAWADNPEGCNLYNTEGLPATPFSTDNQ